ncbi:MAG: Cell division protein FtsQ [Verrucomicrobiota bacterium]|jgi:POTRA domain, FtsQ-type
MIHLTGNRNRNRRRGRGGESGFAMAARTGARAVARRWWLRPVLFTLVAVGLYVGTGWGVKLAREHWLHRIDRLALKHIEVSRDGLLSDEEIRDLAGVQIGRNALTVDPYRVRERLRRHPRVEDAQIRLDFPDTLRISVRERVPVARLMLPRIGSAEACLLVDDLGFVFLPFRRGAVPAEVIESESALPTLLGVNAVGAATGRPIVDPQVTAALKLLALFDQSPLATLADVVNVDVGDSPVLTVLTRAGSRVTLASGRDFEDQLLKWYSVYQHGLASGFMIDTLDLSITNHPPLRWVTSGLPQSPTNSVLPGRDSRPKRKPNRRHV